MSVFSTVKQYAVKNPAFTEPCLRALIFGADHNGLRSSGALIKLGRRILIDDEKFVDWVRKGAQ